VLFAMGLVGIGPHTNALGEIWYAYILNSNTYRKVDPGVLASADRPRRASLWLALSRRLCAACVRTNGVVSGVNGQHRAVVR
jgi:hypothetical protein